MSKKILTSRGDWVDAAEAAQIMGLTESEMATAILLAPPIAEAIHNADIDPRTSLALAMMTDEFINKAIHKRETIKELPLDIVMAEFGITEEQARVVTYFVDGSTAALVALAHMGKLTQEQTVLIARDMTKRTKAAFLAALDTIGEVQGHA